MDFYKEGKLDGSRGNAARFEAALDYLLAVAIGAILAAIIFLSF